MHWIQVELLSSTGKVYSFIPEVIKMCKILYMKDIILSLVHTTGTYFCYKWNGIVGGRYASNFITCIVPPKV